jgi:hypothetical protein
MTPMNTERINLIIKNIESLIDCLKTELETSEESIKPQYEYEEIATAIDDFDEVFYEDEVDV